MDGFVMGEPTGTKDEIGVEHLWPDVPLRCGRSRLRSAHEQLMPMAFLNNIVG